MITAARTMKPLPVRPVDRIAMPVLAPTPVTSAIMHPQPKPKPDFVDAIRAAAFERMMNRLGTQQPLPVVDPTA